MRFILKNSIIPVMSTFKKVVVALDGSQMDRTLIPYTKFLIKVLGIEKIFVVSVIKNLNVPDEIVKEFPEFINQAMDKRLELIQEEVGGQLNEDGMEIDYIIKRDHTSRYIMEFASANDIDLILIGRKLTIPTHSVTVPRLARRANTNLLIIPEGAKPGADKFLVPVDFSDHSKLAIQYAFDIASTSEKGEVICQNVYNIPVGYHYTGKSKSEFGKIMENNAKKNFELFIDTISGADKVPHRVLYNQNKDDDPTSDISAEARKSNPDWVILGAKGRSGTAALFIGSFAEKLIHLIADKPLFIARPKGQNKGLIDYLKNL